MEKNRKKNISIEEEEVDKRYKSMNSYMKKSFFYVFITFVICGSFMILGISDVYTKQKEVNQIKKEIKIATEELESLKLEILSLKGFDKVMEYADYLDMNAPKLGEGIVVDLSKDNFTEEDKKEPQKPLIVRLYEKIFK